MPFASQQLSTQALNPTTESTRAGESVASILQVQTGMIELLGRSIFDWAGDVSKRAKVLQTIIAMCKESIVCNRCLKQTAISLNSCETALYAASACGEELFGLAELSKNFITKFQFVLRWTSILPVRHS